MRPCLGRLAAVLAAASTKLCGRQPLLVSRCCSSVATCCLPAHSVCCLATPTLQANATTRPPQWRKSTPQQWLNPPQRPYTALSCSNGSTLRSGATHCLVDGSRLQTPKRPAAALHTVLLTLQGYHLRASQPLTHCLVGAARVPAFKPLNAPQQPYTVFCWSFYSKLPVASLQTRQPSAAALHALLLGRYAVCRPSDAYSSQPHYTFCRWGFTSAVCQPSDLYSNRYTLRSGSTHCLVEASRPPFASLRSLAALPCWCFKGGSAAPGR